MSTRKSRKRCKVVVFLPFKCYVPYAVFVNNPKDLKEIKSALLKKDPSSWESDPNFYEMLGSDFHQYVSEVTLENVSVAYNA